MLLAIDVGYINLGYCILSKDQISFGIRQLNEPINRESIIRESKSKTGVKSKVKSRNETKSKTKSKTKNKSLNWNLIINNLITFMDTLPIQISAPIDNTTENNVSENNTTDNDTSENDTSELDKPCISKLVIERQMNIAPNNLMIQSAVMTYWISKTKTNEIARNITHDSKDDNLIIFDPRLKFKYTEVEYDSKKKEHKRLSIRFALKLLMKWFPNRVNDFQMFGKKDDIADAIVMAFMNADWLDFDEVKARLR